MAGTPQKMLEHLLETRLEGHRGTTDVSIGVGVAVAMGMGLGMLGDLPIRRCAMPTGDLFLDDFLLTHIVFMPYHLLTEELLKQYPFIRMWIF